jgi:hypothetical protein
MNDQKSYWDTQFSEHGYVWGKTHSKSAEMGLNPTVSGTFFLVELV